MPKNEQRITQLQGAIKLLLLTLVVGLMVFGVLQFGNAPEDQRSDLIINTAELAAGETKSVHWKGREVLIMRRNSSDFARLSGTAQTPPDLYDAESRFSRQPKAAKNPWRSIDKDFFVVINLTPNTGCEVTLKEHLFVGVCDGVKYDLAGRVLAGQASKRNLEVPPHHYDEQGRLVLGRNKGG